MAKALKEKTPLVSKSEEKPKKAKASTSKASFLAHMAKTDKTMDLLRLSDDDLLSNISGYLSTQSISLNKAIGQPGYPMGRLVEISGPEHTGKSTLVDHALAETQRIGGVAALVEPEVSRQASYTTRIGVNPDELIIPQPKDGEMFTLEDVFNWVGTTASWWRENDPSMPVTIAVDSVAAMPTREDLERSAGQKKPGEAASIIKHTLRNLCQRIAGTKITIILVNQLYTRIGYQGWGDPRIEWGGSGIPYHASLRIRLKPGEKIKSKDGTIIGSEVNAVIQKSKISGVSGAKVSFALLHGIGIDNVWTIFNVFKDAGYIAVGGSWYTMVMPDGETIKWQGGPSGLLELCGSSPDLYEKLVTIYHTLP